MKFIFVLLATTLLWPSAYAQNGKEPILITDLLRIKTVGKVAMSDDGSKAAFTVTSIDTDSEKKDDYKYNTQIFMTATDANASPKQLTYSKESSSQPAWCPDNKRLVFVRSVEGKPQIFLLSLDGGEAMQLTKSLYGASNPKWSPDGKNILFSSSISLKQLLSDSITNPGKKVPPFSFERPGFNKNEHLRASTAKPNPNGSLAEIRAYLGKNEVDKKATLINRLNFQDEANINGEINFNYYFMVKAEQGAAPVQLSNHFYRVNGIEFMPDGKQLIMSGLLDSIQNPERVLESQLLKADADGKNLKVLLAQKGKSYSNPTISPSGKWLAFQVSDPYAVNIPQLAVMALDGSSQEFSIIPFDRNQGGLTWSKDDRYLYFTAQSNGGAPLYRADVKSKKIEQLSSFDNGILSFDLKNNTIVFSRTEVADPSALFIADVNMKNERKVSSFNDWVKSKKLSMPERKSFTNSKGLTTEYWVMKPANYQQGKQYPVVLEIHGGPSAMWGPGEASMWHEFQFFASKGYGIVYGNPRGSGGYGTDYLKANINDWGAGPTSDVLTSLDKTVAEGWVDTSRMTVTGGSYAGYLVAWIISHDKRFKAACSQRGVYDLATFFGEGNAWRLVPNYFGGYPWEPSVTATLVRESPINYVQNITTPYIIFHGDNDRRTGFVQSEMLYRSLKVLGRPVEYVRHPGGTHELTRSGDNRQRIDQMLRTYEFFERFIGNNP